MLIFSGADRITDRLLVARKAEKVTAVVHEIMHVFAADERSSSLLRAYEIDRQHENEAGENYPRKDRSDRERHGPGSGCKYSSCCHFTDSWDYASRSSGAGHEENLVLDLEARRRPKPLQAAIERCASGWQVLLRPLGRG